MCFNSPSPPKVQKTDPEAERRKAEAEAAAKANAEVAGRRANMKRSSLLTQGAQGVTSQARTSSVLSYGKQTTGGA